MNELLRIIPDVQVLLALTPEELAEKMLFLLKKRNDPPFTAVTWVQIPSGTPTK